MLCTQIQEIVLTLLCEYCKVNTLTVICPSDGPIRNRNYVTAKKITGRQLVQAMEAGVSLDRYVAFRKRLGQYRVDHEWALFFANAPKPVANIADCQLALDRGHSLSMLRLLIEEGIMVRTYTQAMQDVALTREEALDVCRLPEGNRFDYRWARDLGLSYDDAFELIRRYDGDSSPIRSYLRSIKAGLTYQEAEAKVNEETNK